MMQKSPLFPMTGPFFLLNGLIVTWSDWYRILTKRTEDTLSDVRPKVRLLYYHVTRGKAIFLSVCLTISHSAFCAVYADVPSINLDVIQSIESSGNPQAVSFKGSRYGRGLFQISEVLLQDYCQFGPECPKTSELFNPSVNRRIAKWAFTYRYPAILRWLNRPVTLRSLLICFNAGCGRVDSPSLPKETEDYINKYTKGVLGAKYVLG